MMRVEHPGLMSTVQDRGRPGWQHLGVTPGGAMDPYSAMVAHALLGNAPDAALLEITLHGPRLRFESSTWLALAGADLSAQLDGRLLPTWRPVWVPAGACLYFGQPRLGCRAYLAVAGGFAVAPVLGSRSTDSRAGFGGLDGHLLRAGDGLAFGPGVLPPPEDVQRIQAPAWFVAWSRALPLDCPARLRLIPGPDWQALPAAGRQALADEAYRVGSQSDRMGLRLEGPALSLDHANEKLSAGVAFGTLQLPPGGAPILLGADRQTTGGYPVLGTVASVDHPRLAQLKPGDPVRFEAISVERAQALYRLRAQRLSRLLASLELRWPLNCRMQEREP